MRLVISVFDGLMKKYLIPLAIYLAFIGLYAGYSEVNIKYAIFLPVWDIEHYLSISEDGYVARPCIPGKDYPPGKVCGNVGWYPMWPLTVRYLRPLFDGVFEYSFLGLVYLFGALGFLLSYLYLNEKFGSLAATISLIALALSPPGFYLLTGFPYAFIFFLFAFYVFLLYNKTGIWRDMGLFITGLMLSLSYPSGVFYGIIPLVWYWCEHDRNYRDPKYWINALKYLAPFALGPLILWSYFYFKFDDFFLQLHFQEKYARTWAFPFWTMARSLIDNSILTPENLTMLWYGLVFLLFYPYKVRREFWILAVFLFLFSPATGSMMSLYRHYLIIFPIYAMIGLSSRPLWFKLIFIALGAYLALAKFFPAFINYQLI